MRLLVGVVFTAALAAAPGGGTKANWSAPPYKPVSQQMPAAITALESFGSIEWTMADLPFVPPGPQGGVSGMAMTAVAGRVCMAGGYIPAGDDTADRAGRETAKSAYCYEPKTKKWTRLPDLPVRREYPRGLSDGSVFYVVGGGTQKRGTPEFWEPSGNCYQIDIDAPKKAWQTCGALSVPRSHMAVGQVGKALVVSTGAEYNRKVKPDPYQRRATTDVLWLDKPAAGWKAVTPIPGPARGWSAGASCAGQLWVLGGIPNEGSAEPAGTWAYDPAKDAWTRKTPPPVPMAGWEGACYQDRYVIAVGGHIPHPGFAIWSDIALAYDIQKDQWLKVDGVIPGGAVVNDVGVALVGDTIFAAGGEGPRGTHFDYLRIGRIKGK